MNIPESFQDLLLTGKHFANLATINPDGSPQLSPIWIDYDKSNNIILVNTAVGRKKARNMFVGAKVALTILDVTNPYRYLGIQGEVSDITKEGAQDHIDSLALKYMGREKYPLPEGEIRIVVKIKPKFVHTMG